MIGAIRAGYRALVRSAFDLCQDFAEADALSERKALVKKLIGVDVLIIEDFGMKKLGPTAAEDLLEIFVRRHEAASTIVTTNRPTQDWGAFLGDVPAATAILDRFLSRAQIIQLQGKSYRLHQQRVKLTSCPSGEFKGNLPTAGTAAPGNLADRLYRGVWFPHSPWPKGGGLSAPQPHVRKEAHAEHAMTASPARESGSIVNSHDHLLCPKNKAFGACCLTR